MQKERIVILGSTGSVGTQTLQIIDQYPDLFHVVGMSAMSNAEKLVEYADKFDCPRFFLTKSELSDSRRVSVAEDLVSSEMDHLIVADHGIDSFSTVLKALSMNKKVSIANKELLIIHGSDLIYFAREKQSEIIPLDSEHNAIFQCMRGENISDVSRLIITASGGPFLDKSSDYLQQVRLEEVLKHPNWSMGKKTTVDSANLVNKAFEVIEAHILFDIPYDRIEVRLHPQSIVHAIVEFTDGSSKCLAYKPDMRFSIGYALFYPNRAPSPLTGDCKDFFDYDHDLVFKDLKEGMFPCFDFLLNTARKKPGSIHKLVQNDSLAVKKFLNGDISFNEIYHFLSLGLT